MASALGGQDWEWGTEALPSSGSPAGYEELGPSVRGFSVYLGPYGFYSPVLPVQEMGDSSPAEEWTRKDVLTLRDVVQCLQITVKAQTGKWLNSLGEKKC